MHNNMRMHLKILYIIKAVFAVVVRSYPLRAGTDHEFSRNFVGTYPYVDVSKASGVHRRVSRKFTGAYSIRCEAPLPSAKRER